MASRTLHNLHMQVRRLTTHVENTPLKYAHTFNPKITPPRQAWVETFLGVDKKQFGIIDLHPKVFGVFPRIDHASEVIKWQQTYREVNYLCMPTRNELPGGTLKPWPQKGTGRARHGSVNSPIFLKGGWARGPRGPVTQFRLRPHFHLVNAMRTMLTVKLAQDDIKIVDTLDTLTSSDTKEFEQQLDDRQWGPSVLIVDTSPIFPDNLVSVSQQLNHVNLMPVLSLNALSMAKHETLVLTLAAIRNIEDKLLHQIMRVDLSNTHSKYRDDL